MDKNKKVITIAVTAILCLVMLIFAFISFNKPLAIKIFTADIKSFKELNDYTPIAFDNDSIICNSLDDNTMLISEYNINANKLSDIGIIEDFYISYTIPAMINNTVYLPVTLTNGEYNLLSIDIKNKMISNIFSLTGSEPLVSISTTSNEIFTLRWNFDMDGIYHSNIEKYNRHSKEMELCITKNALNKNDGQIITAFACYDEKIYAIIEEKNDNHGVYMNVYDAKEYYLLSTLRFNQDFDAHIISGNIAQFYSFGNYIYVRSFSDNGIIGKIYDAEIEPVLLLPRLRYAYNSKNSKEDNHIFYMRESNEYYILNTKEDGIKRGHLLLDENESIRHAVSSGDSICVNVLDDSVIDFFTTKQTEIYSYDFLIEHLQP